MAAGFGVLQIGSGCGSRGITEDSGRRGFVWLSHRQRGTSGTSGRASEKPHCPPHMRATGPVPADLDRLIHERVRLGIVSALAVNRSLTFNELKPC